MTDLGSKAKTLKQRNQARAMLAGAPLFAVQLRELEFRQKMVHGNTEALKKHSVGYSAIRNGILENIEFATPVGSPVIV